jgi:hypothetical protein
MQFCYKPGDKVVIRREDDFDWRYRLETVEAITPSGQIWCTDKSRFLPSGNRIGEVSEEMLPATDEHIQLFNAQELSSRFVNLEVVRERPGG